MHQETKIKRKHIISMHIILMTAFLNVSCEISQSTTVLPTARVSPSEVNITLS